MLKAILDIQDSKVLESVHVFNSEAGNCIEESMVSVLPNLLPEDTLVSVSAICKENLFDIGSRLSMVQSNGLGNVVLHFTVEVKDLLARFIELSAMDQLPNDEYEFVTKHLYLTKKDIVDYNKTHTNVPAHLVELLYSTGAILPDLSVIVTTELLDLDMNKVRACS